MKYVGHPLFFSTLSLILLCAAKIVAADDTTAVVFKCERDIKQPLSTLESDPFVDSAVALLTTKTTDESASSQALEKLVRQPVTLPAHRLLQDRARLLLAARALRDGQHDRSRRLLLSIEGRSAVAVDAGLLLAHGYRLAGDEQQALQWLLRVAHQYPEQPAALSGLLRAGDDLLVDGKPGMARTLFDETGRRAQSMMDALSRLPADPAARADLLFRPTADQPLPEPLRQQLIQQLLRHAHDAMAWQQHEYRYRNQLHCLSQQHLRLAQQKDRARINSARLEQSLAEGEQALAELREGIAVLEAQLVANNFSAEQRDIRQQLTRARNHLAVLDAQHRFLSRSRTALPTMLARIDDQLSGLMHLYGSLQSRAGAALTRDIDMAVNTLRAAFSDIAAESHWRLAELRQPDR